MDVENHHEGGRSRNENFGAPTPYGLWNLQPELIHRIARFLPPADAVGLSRTCASLRAGLSLGTVSRAPFASFSWGDADNDKHRSIRLPVWRHRVHSVTLSFLWRDQGWGNLKGQVYIVGTSKAPSTGNNESGDSTTKVSNFEPGVHRVVCTSPVASHDVRQMSMTFVPVDGEVYHLWYRVGGGGGHALHLRDGILRSLIFDDEDRNLSKNFQTLQSMGALTSTPSSGRFVSRGLATDGGNDGIDGRDAGDGAQSNFYPLMLINVTRMLRNQIAAAESAPDGRLMSFMEEFGIPATEASLTAVEEIVRTDLRERATQDQERLEAARIESLRNDGNNSRPHRTVRLHHHHLFVHDNPFRAEFLARNAPVQFREFRHGDHVRIARQDPAPAPLEERGQGRAVRWFRGFWR